MFPSPLEPFEPETVEEILEETKDIIKLSVQTYGDPDNTPEIRTLVAFTTAMGALGLLAHYLELTTGAGADR